MSFGASSPIPNHIGIVIERLSEGSVHSKTTLIFHNFTYILQKEYEFCEKGVHILL